MLNTVGKINGVFFFLDSLMWNFPQKKSRIKTVFTPKNMTKIPLEKPIYAYNIQFVF